MSRADERGKRNEVEKDDGVHRFDDDGCCVKCGFDGAEWHWWKHSTYEGRASDQKMPRCSCNARAIDLG